MNCCNKPSVQNFDYIHKDHNVENRMCLSCNTHWHFNQIFTGKEWANLMDYKFEYKKQFQNKTNVVELIYE